MNHLYELYLEDFFYNKVYYKGMPVKTFTNLNYNGKQQSFEHITTKGSKDRIYNVLRCERIKWIKKIIESLCNGCDNIATWQEKHKNKYRIIIWCQKTDFVIVLERRKNEYYLITAYCVIYENKRKDLRKKYIKYITKDRSRLSQR
ncbi:hypothetical protein Y919_02505 [Caloranaerobacter azorensis H53214]|uniref:Phage-Barnase-EndoU-ColicinE5/D-RelE like nuclease 2 domain-containing protein n=1 Tax=Caloranaerobacter azorensis H53214 TaxID=1156417 RepID=A0A096BJQ0_9FIRM|nr:hypothetical protein [Caloranaerobacter azorensis]KGG81062.1 hypothetical protein Y919_02505 [Caloranaerobacter azorensis H53214]